MWLNDLLEHAPKRSIVLGGVFITALVGWCDYWLPGEVTLFAFYIATVLLVAWYAGGQAAFFVALLSIAVWWAAETEDHPFAIMSWRALNRFFVFGVVISGGGAMRAQRKSLRERITILEKTRRLEDEIVRAGEREQTRIGQDLHDGLCQQLVAIDFAVACLMDDLHEHLPAQVSTGAFIHQQLKRAIVDARGLARGIVPVQIGEKGFAEAVRELVSTQQQLQKTRIVLEAPEQLHLQDARVATHLYRIIQEALSNALKHAQAECITVRLLQQGTALRVEVSDDGCGFPPGRTPGLGTQTLQHRAEAIGAELRVTSVEGKGTTVTCTAPAAV